MKIRSGFVSNSSSSSFIVAFPKIPTSADEVKALLFPDGRETYGCYDHSYSTDEVAKTIWYDIQKSKPNDKDAIWDAAHGWLEGQPETDWSAEKVDWKAYSAECCKHRQKVIKEFYEQNPNAYIYCFHYGDDNGSFEEALEHGGLFDALPHIVSSHH
ncbi:MAG: hypothetical protein ACXAC5_04195 [Promethearchaeota archaeon]|jgi:hypothetical protein